MLNVLPEEITAALLLATVILPDPTVETTTVPVPPLPIGPLIARSPVFCRLSVAPATPPRRPATIPANPCTVSAVLLVNPTLPSATRSLIVVIALLASPSTMLPTFPVSRATVSGAPTTCVTAPVVCKSSVFGLALFALARLVVPATAIALLPVVPPVAPTRSVAALSV